ncbi:hypothetical protein G7Z17_g11384 [Cylindrodendrum hubeiense]|uniref:Uncharacterized protein n=1 Tax=Cylindrodendrum hubeiense TaxID=595255 RepID=A0A9P5H425_9HYPO|nr:hypothetical protein G7Z17_g11384 [Cylindrodendrum hubeiense]
MESIALLPSNALGLYAHDVLGDAQIWASFHSVPTTTTTTTTTTTKRVRQDDEDEDEDDKKKKKKKTIDLGVSAPSLAAVSSVLNQMLCTLSPFFQLSTHIISGNILFCLYPSRPSSAFIESHSLFVGSSLISYHCLVMLSSIIGDILSYYPSNPFQHYGPRL